jgi:hypothetical protein
MEYNGKDAKLKHRESIYEHLNEYFPGWRINWKTFTPSGISIPRHYSGTSIYETM